MKHNNRNSYQSVSYANRVPENMVLSGYRCWLTAFVWADQSYVQQCEALHKDALGDNVGTIAAQALAAFIETLGTCATCPLRFNNCQKDHLCRDECLVLGLIAGIQHGDDDLQQITAETLTCPLKAGPVVAKAGWYALALKTGGAILSPISTDTIQHLIMDEAASSSNSNSNSFH